MKCNIHGDKILITSSIKKYVISKLEKLDKYFDNPDIINARIVVKIRGHEQIIEITIPMGGLTLRSEETHLDLYASIDLAIDKLERQITKNKAKMQSKKLKNVIKDIKFDYVNDEIEDVKDEKIVRRKKMDMKPMSEEEAILQLNMVGHDFFIYKDEKNNKICVLYKRKAGNYGVIETD